MYILQQQVVRATTTTTASGIGSKKRLGIENRLREFQIVCILIEKEGE